MKPSKYDLWAIGSLLAALFVLVCMSASVRAEPLSQHNEQHAAEQAAADRLFDAGCQRTKVTRAQQFRLVTDGAGFRILAAELTVQCVKWPAIPVTPTVIARTWTHPTARKDGSPLALSEIRGYQLTIDGTVTMLAPVTSWQMEGQPKVATIRTVDTNGIQSDPVSLL